MAKITYIEFDGTEHTIDVANGLTVMEGAVKNMVPGIDADCGGACACATCHVYVEDEWLGKLPQPDALEDGMLDCVIDRRPNSRLSCQIRVRDEIDGITVHVPDSQI